MANADAEKLAKYKMNSNTAMEYLRERGWIVNNDIFSRSVTVSHPSLGAGLSIPDAVERTYGDHEPV